MKRRADDVYELRSIIWLWRYIIFDLGMSLALDSRSSCSGPLMTYTVVATRKVRLKS